MDELVQWLREQVTADLKRVNLRHDYECELLAHESEGLASTAAALEMLTHVPGAVCDCGIPAQMARDVEAKTSVLAYVEKTLGESRDKDYLVRGPAQMALVALDPVVRHLATAYEGRPGYRSDWRP